MRTAPAPSAHGLQIAGLVPFSTVDWPGRLVATVFLQGCPWRCTYCHNPSLIPSRTPGRVPWADVAALLGRRRGLLDGVVLTGGEPTRQPGVADAAGRVRDAGLAVGLHTAGPYPRRLAALLPRLDWVGLDVKAPREEYAALTGAVRGGDGAWRSLAHVVASGVEHEVRTTVTPGAADSAWRVACDVRAAGARTYALQQARAEGSLALRDAHPPGWDAAFAELARRVATLGFDTLHVRPA